MRIGELAERAGVSVRSLRYYEEQGLLVSTRSASGQRHYDDSAVERVLYLRQLYAAGLSSRTIYDLLPCTEAPSAATSDAAFDLMVEERDKVDQHITALLRTRDTLDGFIANNRAYRERIATVGRRTAPQVLRPWSDGRGPRRRPTVAPRVGPAGPAPGSQPCPRPASPAASPPPESSR